MSQHLKLLNVYKRYKKHRKNKGKLNPAEVLYFQKECNISKESGYIVGTEKYRHAADPENHYGFREYTYQPIMYIGLFFFREALIHKQ